MHFFYPNENVKFSYNFKSFIYKRVFMQDYFQSIINNIPPLPESVTKIEAYAKDPDISFKQIAQLIEKDPILTSQILKAANLPVYGFTQQIVTLEKAIALFGIGTIRGFVLAVYVRNNFQFTLDPYGISAEDFSFLAAKHNAFAHKWYFKSMPRLFDVISPATFLSNLGQVLISQCLIQNQQTEAFKEALAENSHLHEIETEFCGISSVKLTADIFEKWRLDERLVLALRYLNEPMEAPEYIQIYSKILKCVRTAIPYNKKMDETSFSESLMYVEQYGLDKEKFLKVMEECSSSENH